MATRRPTNFTDNVQMFGAPPPAYEIDRQGSLAPKWYEWRYWGRRKWIMIGVGAALIIAIVIAIGVVVGRKDNRYPTYNRLQYTLAESRKFLLFLPDMFHQILIETMLMMMMFVYRLWPRLFRRLQLLHWLRPHARLRTLCS